MAFKCYKGSTLIKNIYAGSTKVKKVYKGSTLVWQADPYEPGTVLFESSTPQNTRISLEDGLYQIICIAGGGGGAAKGYTAVNNASSAAGGGSGSGANIIARLTKRTYNIQVGSGGDGKTTTGSSSVTGVVGSNSYLGYIITAYGGKAGYCSGSSYTVGQGGATPEYPSPSYIISTTFSSAGNKGSGTTNGTVNGGAALYGSYGKGGNAKTTHSSGGSYSASKGNDGYVKIVYIGQP